MVSEKTKLSVQPWLPAAFCGFLCLLVLVDIASTHMFGLQVVFMFLPMCFVFVGIAFLQTRKEIVELRHEIAELRKQQR